MKNKEALQPEDLGGFDAKSAEKIQEQFGIPAKDLKNISPAALEDLLIKAWTVEKKFKEDTDKLPKKVKKQQKLLAAQMFEELLRDAQQSEDQDAIQRWGGALRIKRQEIEEMEREEEAANQ